ncbi:hypothetical protein N665_0416s0031 [Sinapis alba]|nr:hypothetical protein N665_0416s0031 [Sinapis alba]
MTTHGKRLISDEDNLYEPSLLMSFKQRLPSLILTTFDTCRVVARALGEAFLALTTVGLDLRNRGITGNLKLVRCLVSRISTYNYNETIPLRPQAVFFRLWTCRRTQSLIIHWSIKTCSNLVSVNFSNNKLTGKLGSAVTNCKLLETLSISRNNLAGGGEYWGSFQNLKQLSLAHNRFSARDSRSLRGASSTVHGLQFTHQLSVLDLSSNGFTGNVPSGFSSSPVLQKLLLANNYLSGTVPMELKDNRSQLQRSHPNKIWTLLNLSDLVILTNNLI